MMAIAVAVLPAPSEPAAPWDHVRSAFGRAAYQGMLPRSRWIEAQALVARYDASCCRNERIAIAAAMRLMADGTQAAYALPQIRARHAA